MNTGYIDPRVMASLAKARERRNLKSLAFGLKIAMQIPDGSIFVMLIGTGRERSNQEALDGWVERHKHLIDEATELGIEPIPHLQKALRDHLDRKLGCAI